MAKISYSLLGGISAIVGAGLFNFVWHYGSKPLGANQEIVNTITGKAVILSDLTVVSGIACSVIGFFILTLLSFLYKKLIVFKISMLYPDEKILDMVPVSTKAVKVLLLFPGLGFGQLALPFYLHPDLVHIDMVTRDNLPVFIVILLIFTILCFSITNLTSVLTNKKIIADMPFRDSFYLLKDIDEITNDGKYIKITSKQYSDRCMLLLPAKDKRIIKYSNLLKELVCRLGETQRIK